MIAEIRLAQHIVHIDQTNGNAAAVGRMIAVVTHDEHIALRNGDRILECHVIGIGQLVDIRLIQQHIIHIDLARSGVDHDLLTGLGNDALDDAFVKRIAAFHDLIAGKNMAAMVIDYDNIANARTIQQAVHHQSVGIMQRRHHRISVHRHRAHQIRKDQQDHKYRDQHGFQDLYDLLVEQKEKATSEDLILTFNIRIAKLAATHLGDTDKAIESLKEVLATRSDNMEAINSLIDIYEQQKSYDLALMMLKKKENNVHTNEEKSEVYCHVARLIQKGNWDISQVENSYNAALTLNPKNETALKALFDIAKEAGNIGKQIKLLNVRANNADDADEKNKIYMSIADLADANEGYAKESAEALAKVYETKQDDAELAERLINTYIKADMIDQAVPVLDSIIKNLSDAKQNKRLPPFYSIKGRMLKKSGDLLGARAAFEAAAAIDKNNIPNNLELGILLYEEENYDASLKIMQTLLLHQMNVKDKDIKTNIFYYLGMLRVKTNDPKRAKDMFTRALGVNPNHEPTKEALASL